MPYALCPMPYALCQIVPHVSEKGYITTLYNLFNSFYFFNIYLDNSRFKFYAHNSADFEDLYKTGTLR
jgi:hypothetical protein